MKQFQVIRDFENALSEYTGAPYVTCVNSCTMALRLCLDLYRDIRGYPSTVTVTIPKRTYVSVPIQIIRAGFGVDFEDIEWKGDYQLKPLSIIDSARRFHRNMFPKKYVDMPLFICVSFHYTKILGLGHGGAILHDSEDADIFFKQMRHDGRTDGAPICNNFVKRLGHHCPMAPEIAAQGMVKLASLPDYIDDLPNSNYPDLSEFEIFK